MHTHAQTRISDHAIFTGLLLNPFSTFLDHASPENKLDWTESSRRMKQKFNTAFTICYFWPFAL